MLFDMILILISAILFFLLIKNKIELKNMKKSFSKNKSKLDTPEFSLSQSNDENNDKIFDSLTRLPGREVFHDRLSQLITQSQRLSATFAVMLLNINDFHIINEKYGEEKSDLILREVSDRLKDVIRQVDTMTRLAGDIFVFLIPHLYKPETAVYVAQRLLDSITKPFYVDNQPFTITASIGAAIYPSDGETSNSLLSSANSALKKSKESGKGKFQFFHDKMHALSQRELAIHSAISSVDVLQNIQIYYQFHINVKSNSIINLQAIPYLNVPEYGQIPYLEFAKIAENTGKVSIIGEWLLRNAIIQFLKLENIKLKATHLLVNVTIRQIEDAKFITNIKKIAEELSFDTAKIIFQISELNPAANAYSMEQTFSILNNLGIQIAISIVALGHFALQRITRLPIHYLIINAKFVNKEKTPGGNEAIIQMIISLAKEMNLVIIAEQVENNAQKESLLEIGCTLMQGKLFGEPQPIESYMENYAFGEGA